MTHAQRGLYVDLMALAWDSEEPGTINMSFEQICRELRVFARTLRKFLADFPTTFRQEGGDLADTSLRPGWKLVQPKLELQWAKYQEISAKRSASAKQLHHSASALAFATAPASQKTKPFSPAFVGKGPETPFTCRACGKNFPTHGGLCGHDCLPAVQRPA